MVTRVRTIKQAVDVNWKGVLEGSVLTKRAQGLVLLLPYNVQQ